MTEGSSPQTPVDTIAWRAASSMTDSVGLGRGLGNHDKVPASVHAADLGTRL